MRVLALNLCASMERSRTARMSDVVHVCEENDIDVLLVQEAVRSCLFYDVTLGLADMLKMDSVSRCTFGFPFFFENHVAVITRFGIKDIHTWNPNIKQGDFQAWYYRRAVAIDSLIPGLGVTRLVSVHLASNPSYANGKVDELGQMTDWLSSLPPVKCGIVGGDFNTTFTDLEGKSGFGVAPDYILVNGSCKIKEVSLLPGTGITDHAYGVIMEIVSSGA